MIAFLVVLALILANAVFSGAEIAVLTLRRTRLSELVDEERAGASSLEALRRDPEGFLATVQIGITVVGASAAAFGGATLAAPLATLLGAARVPEGIAIDVALGIVVVVVSFLSLVVGELVPKSLAMRFAERYALAIARPLSLLARLARPVVRFLTACSNLILSLFGDRTSFAESRLSVEELRTLLEESATTGDLDPRAGEIAARALDLHGLTVGAVMTPRTAVRALHSSASAAEVREVLESCRFGRLPVHEGSLDAVRGYVLAREALLRLLAGEASPLEGIVREAPFFPESAEAIAVLRELQQRRVPLGFVVDEQGAFAGLVTLEDLVEEVVGEIFHEKEPKTDSIRAEGGGTWLVDGRTAVREVNRALDLELPEEAGYATIAGLVLHRLGRIPRAGETLAEDDAGVSIEVVESTPRRVAKVRLRRQESAS
jgi:putative hemolysin